MSKKIPVAGLYTYCDQMLRDQWGYIWGTAGVLWTESRQSTVTDETAQKYGSKWIGHMVADCSGVPVYIWRQYGLSIPHGSNSIRRQSVGALVKAPSPGYAAFRVKGEDYHHIGIVGADGATVYESKGTRYGFVTSKADTWDCFAPFKDVLYEEVQPVPSGTQVNYQAEVTTKSGPLNLRSGPGTSYPITDRIPKGATVTVWMEYPDGWRFVDYKAAHDSEQGYVSAQYLTPLPPATSVPDSSPIQDEEGPKITVLRRFSDGVEITLAGRWEIEEGD